MRKLKLQMQLSVDGFIAGPNGETDWIVNNWDPELKKYVYNLTRPVDCILLGGKTGPAMMEYWLGKNNDLLKSEIFAQKINETSKIIFSRTIENVPWKNTRIERGDLTKEVLKLKKIKGHDIIVYGGLSIVTSLMKASLIDEFNLFINPVVLGNGLSIFKEFGQRLDMELVYSTSFDCGITVICYVPKSAMNKDSRNKISWTSDYVTGGQ